MVKHTLEKEIADEIWYVPCANHPFAKTLTSARHRLAMLRFMQAPHTRLCTVELEREGKSYTYNTLRYLTKAHPEHTFSWLMGSDQLPDFPQWKNTEEILKQWNVLVYPRKGITDKNHITDSRLTILKELPTITISSTDIRQRCREKQSIASLADPRIARYIEQHRLYALPTTPH